MTDKAILARVHLFPVRHHSPRSSAVLRVFLDQVRPKIVLVEGPSDATPLIDVIVDKDTRPPIAVLGYRTDGTPGSSLWPFASYSPEYVALEWASRNGAKARFIDVPIGQALAPFDAPDESGDVEPSETEREGLDTIEEEVVPDTDPAPHAPHNGLSSAETDGEEEVPVELACAIARGYRSFEEFWEASFEAPSYNPDEFRETLIAYADLVRRSGDRAMHRARDAYMATKILEAVAEGFEPESIAVVVGAAHAAAFAAQDVDLSLIDLLPDPVPSASTLIPFSYPRLAEQLGYGAGNRAPQYYQRAHDAGGSFRRADRKSVV